MKTMKRNIPTPIERKPDFLFSSLNSVQPRTNIKIDMKSCAHGMTEWSPVITEYTDRQMTMTPSMIFTVCIRLHLHSISTSIHTVTSYNPCTKMEYPYQISFLYFMYLYNNCSKKDSNSILRFCRLSGTGQYLLIDSLRNLVVAHG